MNAERDTICAIATGTGTAGIGIVRLSGPESVEIAERLFRGKRKLSELATFTAAFGQLVVPGDAGEQPLDEVIALVMRAPHTYTTEDVVELSCHGGSLVLRRVLDALVKAGARLAEPGEFTKRAYLGGRIDLSEAEAVMDIVAAENDQALDAAMRQLKGSLRTAVMQLREKLLYETAYIESALDDPENYSLDDYRERISRVLEESQDEIRRLTAGAEEGRLLRQGIRTAIIGRPNAGKSSILNLLLGEERAIVTNIAGTTRDTLEERALLGGLPLVLIDTAGIRDTDDLIERIGVERAKKEVEDADLILYILDASEALTEEDAEILKGVPSGMPVVALLNKQDLQVVLTQEEVKHFLEKHFPENDTEEGRIHVIEISAVTGDGKEALRDVLQQMFFAGQLSENEEKYLLNTRHLEALHLASEALARVGESVNAGVGEDFYTIDLLAAYEALGRITGETLEDDLADKIFAEFCMGK